MEFPGRFVGKFIPFPRQEERQKLSERKKRITKLEKKEIDVSFIDNPDVFNPLLTEWLIEYNFNRPHQSLGYATPIEFLSAKLDGNLTNKVLPMYPIRALI